MDGRFEIVEKQIERWAAESKADNQAIKNDLIRWMIGIVATATLTLIGAGAAIVRYLPLPHW